MPIRCPVDSNTTTRAWWALGCGSALVLVFATWLSGTWGGHDTTRVVDDLGLLTFAALASWCCLRTARRCGRGQRATWVSLTVGLAAWTVGEGVWCYYELWEHRPQTPFPSVADAGFLVFPIAAAFGVALLPGRSGRPVRTRLLDGLLVTGSMFVVSWVVVLGSVYEAGAASHFALVVSLAYPIGDLVLVTMTLLVLTEARTAQRATLALLTAGIALMATSDTLFAYLTATNSYHTGSLIDAGWLAAFALLGSAALSSTGDAAPATRAIEVSTRRSWPPYVPLLLAGAVALPRSLAALRSGPIPVVAVVIVLVLLVRQFLTLAENRRLLITVAHQAFHDPLTGLANRALFTDRLEHAVGLHHRDLRPLAVVCIDLDDFKLVNDSLGHAAGDELLVRVAERLTGCLRAGDTVARLGGDEFAVLIEDGAEHPLLAANRIVEAFGAAFRVDGHSVAVRPSVGVASTSIETPDASAERLLKHADVAMYTAKRAGTGAPQLFQPDERPGDVSLDSTERWRERRA